MKKFLFLVLLCTLAHYAHCQKANVEILPDGNFRQISPQKTAIPTTKTYTDKTGKVYPVYQTEKGRFFVEKVSNKTGKPYRYYLNLPKQ